MISKSLKEHLEWFSKDLIKRIINVEYNTMLVYDTPNTFCIIGGSVETTTCETSFSTSSMTLNGKKIDYENIIREDILSLFEE